MPRFQSAVTFDASPITYGATERPRALNVVGFNIYPTDTSSDASTVGATTRATATTQTANMNTKLVVGRAARRTQHELHS